MNIFYLHSNIKFCARYHCDKHVIKMILETAQLLCTALWTLGIEAPYRKTHVNHPCAIWCRKSKQNWMWLRDLGLALCKEYTYRYGKIHKTQQVLESLMCPDLPSDKFTPPPQCMPEQYKHKKCIKAYRLYYINEKSHLFSWKKRNIPFWINKN